MAKHRRCLATLLAALFGAYATPVSANECVSVEQGDPLSIREIVSTAGCSEDRVADYSTETYDDLDVWYEAARSGSPIWQKAVFLSALYMRSNDSFGSDAGGAARITRIRILVGGEVFDLRLIDNDVGSMGCRRSRIGALWVGGCFYRTVAAFETTPALIEAASTSGFSNMAFRAFLDSGEEVNGVLPGREFEEFLTQIAEAG